MLINRRLLEYMKILFYYLLYLIFLISSILYGSLYIGPVTPRQIMSVVMIVVCIKEGYLFFDKYAKLYFGFVFFYLVACFSTDCNLCSSSRKSNTVLIPAINSWAFPSNFKSRFSNCGVVPFNVASKRPSKP